MSEHLFDAGGIGPDIAAHHSSEMLTDGGGHLVSDLSVGHDGSATFTDANGMAAGTITHDAHGTHYENMAGQEIAHIDHGVVYNATNLPQAQMFTHGNTTDLSDLHGSLIGHIFRTPSGVLAFDGAYPPHQVAFSTKI